MNHCLFGVLLALTASTQAATITGSVAADPGGSVNLTTLGTVDWAHYGRPGAGTGGVDPAADEKTGGTAIGTPTSTRGIFKYYDFSPATYSWTDGTPNAAGSMDHGLSVNDGVIGGGLTEILLPIAASTTPMRVVLYLGTLFYPCCDPDPLATLNATLGAASFSISNISGRSIVTLDFTGDGPSTLNISFNSTALRESGGPETLLLDAVYVQQLDDPGSGVPEPATNMLLVAGLAALGLRRRAHRPR